MEVECKWVGLLHWISMKNNSIFVIVATQKRCDYWNKIIYLNKREKQFKLNCDILHLILTKKKKLKWFIKKLLTFL